MIITTNRLTLRPIRPQDKMHLFRYRSDEQANQYQSWVPKTEEEVEVFIENNPLAFDISDTWFQLVVLLRENEHLIGDLGVHFTGSQNQQVEIGFTLAKDYQRQGYATEAVKGLVDYLFSDLNKHRVTASIDPRNIPSIKLVERIGFRQEAHFKESLYFKGEWVDDVVYALLRAEWGVK